MPAPATPETAAKALVGLIGAGIQRSLTPALHEAEAAAQGLRLHYQLIDLDRSVSGAAQLPQLLAAARTMGFAGLNITYPCKQTVIAELDGLSDLARDIGAVNTVVFRDGRATGHNTDASGWRRAFEHGLPGADRTCVVLLGAGGAGAAVAHALLALGVGELRLVDAEPARAQALAARLLGRTRARVHAVADVAEAMAGARGLVHATPTGMDKTPGLPLPAALLAARPWVSELVYFPLRTALLDAAQATGCVVLDGSGMAVGQAVDAFRLFTGLEPDRARMHAHLQRLLQGRAAG